MFNNFGSPKVTVVLMLIIVVLFVGNLAIREYKKNRRGPGPK